MSDKYNGNKVITMRRLLVIIRLLSSDKGISINALTKSAGITERSVYRYLSLLKDSGFIVEKTKDDDNISFYRLRKTEESKNKLVDYLPVFEHKESKAKKFKNGLGIRQKSPVWIYKGTKPDEFIVYETLDCLLDNHPVYKKDISAIYRKLLNFSIAIFTNGKIIKSYYIKSNKRFKTNK